MGVATGRAEAPGETVPVALLDPEPFPGGPAPRDGKRGGFSSRCGTPGLAEARCTAASSWPAVFSGLTTGGDAVAVAVSIPAPGR